MYYKYFKEKTLVEKVVYIESSKKECYFNRYLFYSIFKMLKNIRNLFCIKLEEFLILEIKSKASKAILIKSIDIVEKELNAVCFELNINNMFLLDFEKNYIYKKIYRNIVDKISISSNASKSRIEDKRVMTLESDAIIFDYSKKILYYEEAKDQFFVDANKNIELISENILAYNIIIRVYETSNSEKIMVYKQNNTLWQCKNRIIHFIFV